MQNGSRQFERNCCRDTETGNTLSMRRSPAITYSQTNILFSCELQRMPELPPLQTERDGFPLSHQEQMVHNKSPGNT